jgi:hypothetical protein
MKPGGDFLTLTIVYSADKGEGEYSMAFILHRTQYYENSGSKKELLCLMLIKSSVASHS